MDTILFDIPPNFKTILCALSRKLSIKRVRFVYGTLKLDIFLFSTFLLHYIHNQFHSDDNNDGQIIEIRRITRISDVIGTRCHIVFIKFHIK